MQALSQVGRGTYTIKWIFGEPEVLKEIRELKLKEGSVIQVIQTCWNSILIATESKRIVLGNEVADRIQV